MTLNSPDQTLAKSLATPNFKRDWWLPTKRIQRHPWTPLAIAAIAWKHHFLCLFQLLGRAHAVQLLRPAPVCFVVRHQIWGDLVANEQLDEVLGQLNLLAVDHMGS